MTLTLTQPLHPSSSNADIPFEDWQTFVSSWVWQPGEHVTIIGPTGQGKTHLARELLDRRKYVLVVALKPRDALLNAFGSYHRSRTLPIPSADLYPKQIFWPPIEDARRDIIKQKQAIKELLFQVYSAGGWTVFLDEGNHVTQFLGLSSIIELLWRQGRSLGVSLMFATQRPFHVPLLAYDQATHLFFFRENDDTNLKRIGALGTIANVRIRRAVSSLQDHNVLYMNTRTGRMAVTCAPARG